MFLPCYDHLFISTTICTKKLLSCISLERKLDNKQTYVKCWERDFQARKDNITCLPHPLSIPALPSIYFYLLSYV